MHIPAPAVAVELAYLGDFRLTIRGWPVDRRHVSAHWAQVCRELTAVMDRVEQNELEELVCRLLGDDLPLVIELRGAVPGLVVHPRHHVGQLIRPSFEERQHVA